jgi:hypothetical protein
MCAVSLIGEFKMNKRNTYLGLAFVATASISVATSVVIYDTSNNSSDSNNEKIACVGKILVPQTAEQADFLENNAAEAYARLDPITQEDLEKAVQMFSDGQPYEITGMSDSGTSTLPDGTKTITPCVTYRLTL